MPWSLIIAIGALVLAVVLVIARRKPATVAVRRARRAPPTETSTATTRRRAKVDVGEAEEEEVDPTRMGKVPSLARAQDDEDARAGQYEQEEEEVPEDAEIEFGDESDEQTGPNKLILVTAVARTDVGKHRANNEDSYLCMLEEPLFVVADGMGGYAGGERASAIAVEVIKDAFEKRTFPGLKRRTRYRRANELVRAIELANEAIVGEARRVTENRDMGTTLVATRFAPSKRRVYVASVGDSRVYRVRDRLITQLTVDHTLASEAGVKGKMGAQLSRAVGVSSRVKVDVFVEEARPNDHYLLCSDGLTKMIGDDVIAESMLADDLGAAAKSLVAEANARGGHDNITVILIRVDDIRRSSQR